VLGLVLGKKGPTDSMPTRIVELKNLGAKSTGKGPAHSLMLKHPAVISHQRLLRYR